MTATSSDLDPERLNDLLDVLLDHDERIAREAAEKSATPAQTG